MSERNQECAAQVMAVFDMIMRLIGSEMHKRSSGDLSIQQFRAMMIVSHHEGANLSLVADYLGTTISAASKIIDSLVEGKFVEREVDSRDRRKIVLSVTAQGQGILKTMKHEAVKIIAGRLDQLSHVETSLIGLAMDVLRSAFLRSKFGEDQLSVLERKDYARVDS